MQKNEPPKSAKEIVINFQETLNSKDLKSARSYVTDDFTCTLPTGSFDGADAYFKAAEQAAQVYKSQNRYEVKKIFVDGNDVCVFNDVIAGPVTILACGWYHVEGGKIRFVKVVYDPRPLMQKQ